MEAEMNFCYSCKQRAKLFMFSCSHQLCEDCISKIIFRDHLQDIYCENSIFIFCTCANGTLALLLSNIYDILKEKEKKKKEKCNKHNIEVALYCIKCEKWLCESCIEVHNELLGRHQMMEERSEDFEKCEEHVGRVKDIYCKDCQEKICNYCCMFKKSKHVEHSYELVTEYAKELRKTISTRSLKYPNFEDFLAFIDNSLNSLRDNFEKRLSSTLSEFDELITALEVSRTDYTDKMETMWKRTEFIVEVIKMLYSNFYSSLQRSMTTCDINLLHYLNEKEWTIQELGISYSNEIHLEIQKMKNRLEKIITMQQPAEFELKTPYVTEDFHPSCQLVEHKDRIVALIQMKDGRLVSGGTDKSILVWEMTGKDSFVCMQALEGHIDIISSLLELRDGRLASGSWDNSIIIWENATDKNFTCTQAVSDDKCRMFCLLQLKNGLLLSCDKNIKIWDVIENPIKSILTIYGHTDNIRVMIQLKDGRIVSGSEDDTIKVWEMRHASNLICINTLLGHSGSVYSLLQLKDGRMASGSEDYSIKIWDTEDFQCVITIDAHKGAIWAVIQLKDERLVSGSEDSQIKIWNKEWGCMQELDDHTHCVRALILLRDGRIASGSWDHSIRIWK